MIETNLCRILNMRPSEINLSQIEQEAGKVPGGVERITNLLNRFIVQVDPTQKPCQSIEEAFQKYCSLLEIDPKANEHPFSNAIFKNDQKIMSIFLSFKNEGFDVNCKGIGGKTAAHAAVVRCDSATLDKLKEAGIDFEAKDDFENTPLHTAVTAKKKPAVEWLVSQKVDIDATNKSNTSPLEMAELERFTDIAKYLLNSGASQSIEKW